MARYKHLSRPSGVPDVEISAHTSEHGGETRVVLYVSAVAAHSKTMVCHLSLTPGEAADLSRRLAAVAANGGAL
jgi:hypothetical protein